MKTIYFDIMLAGKFVFTLRYRYLPCFPLDLERVRAEAIKTRPTLRNKPFKIYADIEDLTSK